MLMKIQKRKIVAPLLAAIGFAALTVGTTFALFTDKAEVQIQVSAGTVSVTASAGSLHTYSCVGDPVNGDRVDENNNKYSSVATAVEGVFTNKGTAALGSGNNTLNLVNISPGDRVTFDVSMASTSNIEYKYRYTFKSTSANDDLVKGLVTKMTVGTASPITYTGLKEYKSDWVGPVEPTVIAATVAHFDIELPIDKGNEYQGLSGSFVVTIEAVQGNAVTTNDGSSASVVQEDFASQPAPKVENTNLELSASTGNTADDITISTLIDKDESLVDTGNEVKLVISDLTVTEVPSSKTATIEFDASLYMRENSEAEFEKIEDDFGTPVQVTIQLKKYLDIQHVYHGESEITNYNYVPTTGVLTFETSSFSPFTVQYEKLARNIMYHFYDSYIEGTGENAHWVHEVNDETTFKNILAHIARTDLGSDPIADTFREGTVTAPIQGKTVVYKIVYDIDFDGTLWTNSDEDNALRSTVFNGTLDGQGHTLSNIKGPATNQLSGGILFNEIINGEFKNFTLRDIRYENSAADGFGLIGYGAALDTTKDARTNSYMKFDGIIVDSTCYLMGKDNLGSLVSMARSIQVVSILNCTNNMDIFADGGRVGGFMYSASSEIGITGKMAGEITRSFIIRDSANNGNLTGTKANAPVAGAITSIWGNNTHYIEFINFTNTGTLRNPNSNLVGPVIADSTSTGHTAVYESAYAAGKIDCNNTGLIINKDGIANTAVLGLTGDSDSVDCMVKSNGQVVKESVFFENHVRASNVKDLTNKISSSGAQSDSKTISFTATVGSQESDNFTAEEWANVASVSVSLRVQMANVLTSTLRGYGSNISYHDLCTVPVNAVAQTTIIPRLMHVAHNYPGTVTGEEVAVTYDGTEPQGERPYTYENTVFDVDALEERIGYGTLSDGSSYFVYDNSNIGSAAQFKVFIRYYSTVEYVINYKNANGDVVAFATVSDMIRNTPHELTKLTADMI